MTALRTDYQDDVLDTSVNTQRRFVVKDAVTGTILNADVIIEEITNFTTEGDELGANIVNTQNAAINQINEDLTDNSKKFKFGYQNGKYGYYKQEGGADTFAPFSSASYINITSTTGGSTSANVNAYLDGILCSRFSIAYSGNTESDLFRLSWYGYVWTLKAKHKLEYSTSQDFTNSTILNVDETLTWNSNNVAANYYIRAVD